MHIRQWALLPACLAVSCGAHIISSQSQSLTAAQFAMVSKGARTFAMDVARDVTSEGPAAWRKHFADSPSFFMASEGRLVFPDNVSAAAGIEQLSRTIPHIELTWGDDLRVDPLTPDLAVVAASWREVLVNQAGERTGESGYFTGVAEQQAGRWRFRNAHWSVSAPAR